MDFLFSFVNPLPRFYFCHVEPFDSAMGLFKASILGAISFLTKTKKERSPERFYIALFLRLR
nr:MAG TPA: hypothetical protein [Caudoviricetes sp.]